MKRFAIVENNIVVNVAISSAAQGENWIESDIAGPFWIYAGGVLSAPVIPVAPIIPDPAEFLIDIGPFFDRFGAAKMTVLTSTDSAVKAILSDIQVRHWVDLKRPDVAQALAYVGSVVPSVTASLQSSILTSPVTAAENMVLRKLYF